MGATAKLNPKQRLFALAYLETLNASEAARRAGYSKKNANVNGPRMLAHAGIAAFIAAHLEKQEKKAVLAIEDLEAELHRLVFFDPRKLLDSNGRMRPLHELDEDTARAIASVDVEQLFEGYGEDRHQTGQLHKVRFWDKRAAIELGMKRRGALTEKIDATLAGKPRMPMSIRFIRGKAGSG